MATVPLPYPPRQKNWIERHWLGFIVGVALFLAAVVAAFVVAIFALLGNSAPVQLAVAKANNSPSVVERLGQPIEKGIFSTGRINTSGSRGHADLKIPISGPSGKGYIYLTADKSADRWTFSQLEVAIDGSEKRIDLLEAELPKNSF